MKVSEEKILNLASQLYMGLDEEETKNLAKDVDKIVSDVDIINEVDTKDIKRDVSVLDRRNSLRKDEVNKYSDIEGLLKNGKEVEDNMFVLPKIVQN